MPCLHGETPRRESKWGKGSEKMGVATKMSFADRVSRGGRIKIRNNHVIQSLVLILVKLLQYIA